MGESSVDNLTENLIDILEVDSCQSDIVVSDRANHPRISLYKNSSRAVDQERRWRINIQRLIRKQKRSDKFDSTRFHDVEHHSDLEKYTCNPWAPKTGDHMGRTWRSFSRHLMLSEWLLFLPPNFFSSYFMKFCPKGRHVCVMTHKGTTVVYSRTGRVLIKTISRIPGGGIGQSMQQNSKYCTMLDCIMESSGEIMDDQLTINPSSTPVFLTVLDVIKYRNTCYAALPFFERRSWLEEYLKGAIEEYEHEDPVRFRTLPSYPCNMDSVQNIATTKPECSLDGVLFYHEAVRYEPGPTPLIGWLKPYMLPEWFPDVKFHPDFMMDVPPDYTDYLQGIQKQETEKKIHVNSSKTVPMES